MANNIIETNKDTSTYDVQQRTFIKRPEPKVCPSCGQIMPSDVQPMKTDMSNYISDVDGAQAVVIASNEDTLTINGVTVYRVTGKDGSGKMISSFSNAQKKAIADDLALKVKTGNDANAGGGIQAGLTK